MSSINRPAANLCNEAVVYTVGCEKGFVESLAFWARDHRISVRAYENPAAFLREAPRLPHGCVVVERPLGDRQGVELVRRLRGEGRSFDVVLIVAEAESEVTFAVEAMREGAREVLRKPVVPEALLVLVERILRPAPRSGACNPLLRLTPREREVLKGVVDGQTNRQIAQALGVSLRTVESHRSNLMSKMGVRSAADLVRQALAGWAR
ncbi:MAG TPA: LuxR C-terminal-related transcriptional regulator [Phenylobacterium sp.]|nr:LuxR C-terminal-related transcriptional regulator [Phenylobacterium sp.]